jgi:hypothetical protein
VTNGWMDGQTDGYVMSHGDQWALPQTQEWFISTFPFFNGIWSRDSSVYVVIGLRTLRAKCQGLIPGKAGKRPDWYWNSASYPTHLGGFSAWLNHKRDHSPLSCTKVKYVWSYTSIPPYVLTLYLNRSLNLAF